MPTTRPRHAVTETPDIHEALTAAARRWPQDRDRPAALLRRLIVEGRRSIDPDIESMRADRVAALHRVSGSYTGLYDAGYLDELREDWPE